MRYLKLSNIINRSTFLYNHGFLKPIKSTQLIKSNYCQRTQYKKLNLTCVYNLSSSTYPKCINQSKIYQMFIRLKHTNAKTEEEKRVKSILMYLTAVAVLIVGLSYAAVPMYRIFCQATSYGGEISRDVDTSKVESMKKIEDRQIKIHFNADTSSSMQWNFKPQQREIVLVPGDTALAFYTATNPTDKPVVGISTYNVIPFDAGQYFNKIQCFCFEEQRLNPHEQVDMPVFFYIDPEFAEDPKMENVKEIILSYTFFEARDGLQLPVPSYYRN